VEANLEVSVIFVFQVRFVRADLEALFWAIAGGMPQFWIRRVDI